MIIKKGKFYKNKTFQYILPSLKMYGPEFAKHFANLFKLAIGIQDSSFQTIKPTLFILIDSEVNTDKFVDTIKWFKEQDFYVIDYPFDSINNGYQHMLVISIPKQVYSNFISSNYSKMYTKDEIKRYGFTITTKKILLKDKLYAKKFVTDLNKTWDTSYTVETWHGELDYPWKDDEERFNF